MKFALRTSIVALSLCFGLAACDTEAPESKTASAADAKDASKDGAKTEAPAGDAIEPKKVEGEGGNAAVVKGEGEASDDRFTLQVDGPNMAAPGESGVVTIKVLPEAPWHMNLDYPTSLKMDPVDGVTMAKAQLKKGDAKTLDEDSAEYQVQFTADTAGDKTFKGKFKFAVCQDEACSPVAKDVEFKLAVK